MKKVPKVNIDILVIKNKKVLLGLLSPKWQEQGKLNYGVPGRDILFGETIGETIKRNIKEEFGCGVKHWTVISVNANYALGNHYIGIGVVAEIDSEPKVLLPDDWERWEWFDIDNMPQNLFAPAKNLIDSYRTHKITVSE
jgi:ADP-ribose pyrophosphatase YjhB (NUDIX family)